MYINRWGLINFDETNNWERGLIDFYDRTTPYADKMEIVVALQLKV